MFVGGVDVENRVWLAPLAGITVSGVRLFFRSLGAGLTHTEMISCAGLLHGSRKTVRMLSFRPQERPLVLQLFAGDADTLIRGAEKALEGDSFDALGVNMACPMPKVLKKGAGARLLESPETAREMVESLGKLGLPVWVKTRKMPPGAAHDTVEFTHLLLEAGASSVAVHGRTPGQRYGGVADREVVKRVAGGFPGFVAASGDVFSAEDAADYLAAGCSAVLAARGAVHDPFMIPRALERCGFSVPSGAAGCSRAWKLGRLIDMGDDIADFDDPGIAVVLLKRFVSGIFKGLRGASEFRRTTALSRDWPELRKQLQEWQDYAERGEQM